jgi:choline dehydrogenase-like flavoprotein
LTGEAAMDPQQSNHVRLNGDSGENGRDRWQVPKADIVFSLSERDWNRVGNMICEMRIVAAALGGKLPDKLEPMPPGRSHHEGGTLRMGTDPASSVVDLNGRFHGIKNLFAADASVFPSVGVANPMLTITAIGYHVAIAVEQAIATATAPAVSVEVDKRPQPGTQAEVA